MMAKKPMSANKAMRAIEKALRAPPPKKKPMSANKAMRAIEKALRG
jgi:hypothetical protein